MNEKVTEEDVLNWISGSISGSLSTATTWLTEILNGEYDVNEAREDCLSLRKDDYSEN